METARIRRVCLAVVLVTAAFAAMTTTAASSTAYQASCSGFTGGKWSFPEFSKSGTHWKVTAQGVTCEFATRWAKKLVKTKYNGEAATKLHGPKGWHCLDSIPHGGGLPGSCRQGKHKLFSWGPDVKL
jgi:hypothetical protein